MVSDGQKRIKRVEIWQDGLVSSLYIGEWRSRLNTLGFTVFIDSYLWFRRFRQLDIVMLIHHSNSV